MKFQLLKQGIVGPAVPQAVFDNLRDAKENDLKVILYVLQTGEADLAKITNRLNITVAAAQSSLLFWSDKGLILYEEESATTSRKKPVLSARQLLQLSQTQPEINVLVTEIQKIYGHAINEKGTNAYVDLYLHSGVPVEVILVLAAYLVPKTDKGRAYTCRVIEGLHGKNGITDIQKAEEYIVLSDVRRKRYADVCAIFGLDTEKLTKSEKTMIDAWGEKLEMSIDMIRTAWQTAAGNDSLKYCGGILKSWSQKGYKKPEDIQEYSPVQRTEVVNDDEDIMLQGADFVPVFNKGV